MERYEQFPHTADIGIRVYGVNLEELFENAAFAMFDIMADLEGIDPSVTQDFEIKAENRNDLLVAWLEELLYEFCTKQIIFSEFRIKEISNTYLSAEVSGQNVGKNRNRLKTEIKAATYSGVDIKKTENGYEVEIILDV
jgi:SHS2 domain-containing protein